MSGPNRLKPDDYGAINLLRLTVKGMDSTGYAKIAPAILAAYKKMVPSDYYEIASDGASVRLTEKGAMALDILDGRPQ